MRGHGSVRCLLDIRMDSDLSTHLHAISSQFCLLIQRLFSESTIRVFDMRGSSEAPQSALTGFLNVPIPVIVASIMSPFLRKG